MKVKLKIKNLMIAKNISVYDLAQKSDLTEACIRNWFTSRNYTPSLEAIEKVCNALEISVFELFCDEDDIMPVNKENRAILQKLQILTGKQRAAILNHIESYINF